MPRRNAAFTQQAPEPLFAAAMDALEKGRPFYGSITGLAPGPGFVHACGQRVKDGDWYYMRIHLDMDVTAGSVGVALIQDEFPMGWVNQMEGFVSKACLLSSQPGDGKTRAQLSTALNRC